MKSLLSVCLLLAALGWPLPALCVPADAPANQPQSYALQLPLTLAAGTALQRLALPAQVLVNLQSASYSDLRIFNAAGQPVPMALAQAEPGADRRQQIQLPAWPLLGPASTTELDGLSLRIEERDGQRVAQISTGNASNPAAAQVLGALLDARAVSEPLVALQLQAELPEAQPVTFSLHASRDLSHWQLLGRTVLFQAGATRLGDSELILNPVDIRDHYLRITWSGAAGQPAAARVQAATLTTSSGHISSSPVEAALATPALLDSHTLNFTLPFATPLSGLRITPPDSNVLIPLRVLGRNERSQPWTPLASGLVYRLQTDDALQESAALPLPGRAFRELQLQADQRTPGFSAAPAISLQFAPVQLVFLASGDGPFVLAAGRAHTPAAYLPMASLIPDYRSGQENRLPLAQTAQARPDAAATAGAPLVQAAPGSGNGLPVRSWVLWGVLLLGVLALALMAGALLRQMRQPPAD